MCVCARVCACFVRVPIKAMDPLQLDLDGCELTDVRVLWKSRKCS